MVSSKKSPTTPATKSAQSAGSCIMRWVTRLTVLGVFIALAGYLDAIKAPLHELAQSAIAANPDDTSGMINYIVKNLTETYPVTQIRLNPDVNEWMFNNAGGAMGAIVPHHLRNSSGTEGHTGLHTADDYFHILVGEQWAFAPGALELERYPAGSVHVLPRFTAKQYKMHEGCFALEYARGWIPLMLPFGFADTVTSTLDLPTFGRTAWITGREMLYNLLIGKI
ncbi:hypothetical protein D9611_007533 [Ephemerocybe angulata]|uniref:C-8 sterol isomerase n=1 Tax=Ephemerocybe angulata TaxID=980116 RepID=A0A8H5FCG5_9AGAR|nr:hypothetical protein D9611_007533 [Tulosesus angulatus]